MISKFETQYMKALSDIYKHGYEDGKNERTGKCTKRLPGIVFRIDVEKEFPILKSKFVAGKTALREILWIFKDQSNNIHDLNAKIWDEWADENGCIGKSYGYQMKNPISIYTDPVHKTPESFRSYKNQTEFILEYLREFPTGRWAVSTLWNTSDLAGMNLVPCCYSAVWNLDGGRLNCMLCQRSGDMPYGVPFDTTQYAELMILFAKDLGVKPGILTHTIADAHIYENQMDGVELQLAYWKTLRLVEASRKKGVIWKETEKKAMLAAKSAANCHNKYIARLKEMNPKDTTFGGMSESRTADEIFESAKNACKVNSEFILENVGDTFNFFETNDADCKLINPNMGKIYFGEVAV